jgi:hypothetical protein
MRINAVGTIKDPLDNPLDIETSIVNIKSNSVLDLRLLGGGKGGSSGGA